MPEEIEAPTEHLHETLHEQAHGHGGGEGPPSWVSQVALSAAMVAVLAAISAMLAGHNANEAMLEQMKATDEWGYYQAKGIKAAILDTKMDVMTALSKEPHEADRKKVEEYRKEQKEIEEKARHEEKASREHMVRHGVQARAVTASQVAIALSAIAVLSRKKWIWFGSLLMGGLGALLLAQSFL
jgi:uncharacterized membrane protein